MAERRSPKRPLNHKPAAVRKARERTGLTRTEVASELGVSLSLISEIEGGTRNATPAMILRLAALLNCDPDSLRRRRLGPQQKPPSAEHLAIVAEEPRRDGAPGNRRQMSAA
jgi:transcriptional regulator with XRE-family HTH domain